MRKRGLSGLVLALVVATSGLAFGVGCTASVSTGPKTLTYTVKVNASLTPVAKIFNTVSVADDNTHGDELDATNDSFTHDVLVGGAPDLSVTAGQKLLLNLQYKNAGSEPAPGSTLVVTLPPTVVRDEATGTIYASHMSWMISTFWWTVFWVVVLFVPTLILTIFSVGLLSWLFLLPGVWFLYRMLKGLLRLTDNKPVP